MKTLRLLMIVACIAVTAMYSLKAQPHANPESEMILSIVDEGGNNGCAVVFNPEKNLYYTVFAGNSSFPLSVFSANGEPLYSTDAGFDARGLWYNNKTGNLEGNGYGSHGIFAITLDSKGYPSLTSQIYERDNQPDEQSINCFNEKKKELLGYFKGNISTYKLSSGKPGKTIKVDVAEDDINSTAMIYTGKKGYDYGLLDYMNNKVLFFNKKGVLTATTRLPLDQYCESSFNFSFANNRIWIFDTEYREWTGYLIF